MGDGLDNSQHSRGRQEHSVPRGEPQARPQTRVDKDSGLVMPPARQSLHDPYKVPTDSQRSNVLDDKPIIYVNGMNMTPDRIKESAEGLAQVYGRDVSVIPNNTESFAKDLSNSVAGAVGHRMGSMAEKYACENLKREIIARYVTDENPIRIVGYSQGTLVINNVLQDIKGELSPKEWAKLAERIDLRTFGAAAKVFPKGIHATGQQHNEDPVPGAVASATMTIDGLKNILTAKIPNVTKTTKISHEEAGGRLVLPKVKLEAHDAAGYAQNAPRFILKSISKLHIEEQASALVKSIRKGEYSDEIYNACVVELGNMALGKNPEHAQRAIALSRELSRESKIGKFEFGEEAKEILKLTSNLTNSDIVKPKTNIAQRLGIRL